MVVNERPKVKKYREVLDGELRRMAEDKHIDENVKKYMRHKPYKCDFGGGSNGKKD